MLDGGPPLTLSVGVVTLRPWSRDDAWFMAEAQACCGVDDWSDEAVAQFGYWIGPEARGRGYATRAVILLTRWLFDRTSGH